MSMVPFHPWVGPTMDSHTVTRGDRYLLSANRFYHLQTREHTQSAPG